MGGVVQDVLELGQQLVAGDDGLRLGLIQTMSHSFLSKIGVESHHGEGLFEAGL